MPGIPPSEYKNQSQADSRNTIEAKVTPTQRATFLQALEWMATSGPPPQTNGENPQRSNRSGLPAANLNNYDNRFLPNWLKLYQVGPTMVL